MLLCTVFHRYKTFFIKVLAFFFLKTKFLCSPGCPGIPYVEQTGLESERCACLRLLGSGIKGVL